MTTPALTLRIPEEMKAKLDTLARATQRPRSFLTAEAIARYLDIEVWQIGEIGLPSRKRTWTILRTRPTWQTF